MLSLAVNEVCQGPLRCLLADQVPSGLDGGFVLLSPSDGICLTIEGLGLPGVPLQAYISRVADFAALGETLVDGGHAPAPGPSAVGRQ